MSFLKPLSLQGLVLLGLHGASLSDAVILRDPAAISRTYDYIVAGGGLSGLVVASRLTQDLNTSVLVVEYGDFDDSWDVAIPYYARYLHTKDLFNITSVPQNGLGNRSFDVYLGKTVGGGSTVNGMALSRGARADYDAWEALGNPGWGWESMFRYFKKSSTLTYPSHHLVDDYEYVVSPEGYGQGPMQAGFPSWQFPALYNFIDAWTKDIGVEYRTDGDTNGENLGMAWKPIDIDPRNVTRMSAQKAYYDPARDRPNLDILVGSYVGTLVTGPGPAVLGVNVTLVNGTSHQHSSFLRSAKEVILATGAIHTAQVLQLSGIGPASLLEPLGIQVIADLPGVGANFQDHPTNIGFAFKLQNEPRLNPNLYDDASFFNASWDEYMANRTGPMTWAFGNNRVVLSLQNLTSDYQRLIDDLLNEDDTSRYLDNWYKQDPTLQAGYKAQHEILARIIAAQHGSVAENTFAGAAAAPFVVTKPLSRGTVLIHSANTTHPVLGAPSIDFQAFTHPFDIQIAIAALRMARRLISSPSLAPLRPVETAPGPNVTTDAQIEAAIRASLYRPGNAHPCCTAAMMPLELGGVVDPRLRVYGVARLRVVDASILPLIPSAHTQETMYAVAEKAADIIRGR